MNILYVDNSYKYSSQDKEVIKHSISNSIHMYLPHEYYVLLEDSRLQLYYISNIYLDISMWLGIKDNKFLQVVYPYLPTSFNGVNKESIGYGMHKDCSLKSVWLEFIFNISNKFRNIRDYASYSYFISKYSGNDIEILGGFKDIEYRESNKSKSYVLRSGCVNKDTCSEWSIYQSNKRYVKSDVLIKDYYILSKEGKCIGIEIIEEAFLSKHKSSTSVYIAELVANGI